MRPGKAGLLDIEDAIGYSCGAGKEKEAMGYETTLHLVPENGGFARAVIGYVEGKQGIDGPEQCQEMAGRAREAFLESQAKGNVDGMAMGLCYLMLMLASRSHPYVLGWGCSFSLWENWDAEALRIPEDLIGSADSVAVRPFLERWPELAGRFSREFCGNWETGMHVGSDRAGMLADWMEARVEADPENVDIGDFVERMAPVLRYAAETGMGVWEATDLPMMGEPRERLDL